MKDKQRRQFALTCAQEFRIRIGLMRLREPKFNALSYRTTFCHERCITIEEFNEAYVRLLLEVK